MGDICPLPLEPPLIFFFKSQNVSSLSSVTKKSTQVKEVIKSDSQRNGPSQEYTGRVNGY